MYQNIKARPSIGLSKLFFLSCTLLATGLLVTKEGSYDSAYFVTLSITFFTLSAFLFNIVVPKRFECYIPFFYVLIWLYGFILGIIRHNNFSYIARNFAGMTVYVYFYLLLFYKIDIRKLTKMLYVISDVIIYITFVAYVVTFVFHNNIFFRIPILNRFDTGGTIEYYSRELIYISLAINLYKVLFHHEYKIKYFFKIVLIFVVEFFCIQSGGDCLASVVILCLMGVIAAIIRPTKWIYLLIFAVIIGLICFILIKGTSLLFILFSHEDKGNITRYAQIEYILSKGLSFWGHGLGAVVNPDAWHNYAIEVIYLNIYHKFGVFAFAIYYFYYYTIKNAIIILRSKNLHDINSVPLACMGYCFSALANPLLYAPQNVLLHSTALYIIYKKKNHSEYFANWYKLV